MRESVLAGLSATRRALVHRSLAGALDSQPGRAGEVARHLLEARPLVDPALAARAALRAAEEATRRLAYEDAAELLERAGDVEGDARLRAEVLLALGDARQRSGDAASADRCFVAAAAEARALGAGELLARAALGAAGLTVTVGPVRGEVRTLLEEALAAVAPDSPLRPRLLSRLAIESYYARPTTLRERLSEEALGDGRRLGGRALLEALGARHVALWSPAHAEERLRIADELVAAARAQGDREAELQGVNWRVADLVELGDVAQARAAIDEHERLAGELRLLGFAWYVPMWRAMLALMAGRLDEAQRFAEEGERIGQAAGDRNAALLFQVQRLAVRFAADRLTDADVAEIEAAARRSPAGAAWRMWATAIALLRGDREGGRRRVLEEAKALDSLPLDANWLYSATALGIQLAHLGDADAAAAVYPRVLPYRRPGGHVGTRERLQRLGRALPGPARGDARRPRGRRRPPRGGGAAQRRARSGPVRRRGPPCAVRAGRRSRPRRRAAPRGGRGDEAARARLTRTTHARLTVALRARGIVLRQRHLHRSQPWP